MNFKKSVLMFWSTRRLCAREESLWFTCLRVLQTPAFASWFCHLTQDVLDKLPPCLALVFSLKSDQGRGAKNSNFIYSQWLVQQHLLTAQYYYIHYITIFKENTPSSTSGQSPRTLAVRPRHKLPASGSRVQTALSHGTRHCHNFRLQVEIHILLC